MPSQSFLTWLETYSSSSYSSDELAAVIEDLKKDVSIFSSQNTGSKSFTRDLGELRDRLAAATRARLVRPNTGTSGTTDFSCVEVS